MIDVKGIKIPRDNIDRELVLFSTLSAFLIANSEVRLI